MFLCYFPFASVHTEFGFDPTRDLRIHPDIMNFSGSCPQNLPNRGSPESFI